MSPCTRRGLATPPCMPPCCAMSSLGRHPCSHGDQPRAQENCRLSPAGHRLHHPAPLREPKIRLGVRKWVVLSPQPWKASESCLLRLYSKSPHKAWFGGNCLTLKMPEPLGTSDYLTPQSNSGMGILPSVCWDPGLSCLRLLLAASSLTLPPLQAAMLTPSPYPTPGSCG